ncbi:MAG: hypothetical protein R6V10_00485 [bacterium]
MIGYVILGLGIINLVLVWFQISSGRRWLKVPIKVHRKTGIVLVVSATVHGVLALLVNLL